MFDAKWIVHGPQCSFLTMMLVGLAIISLLGCGAKTAKMVKPNWKDPKHRRVVEEVTPLLASAGRSPVNCGIFFIDTEEINAVSTGNCRFGFTMGIVNTGDVMLIRGVAAHEIAHDVLGHADKRQTAAATEQMVRTAVSFIPGIGGLIASGAVLAVGTVALPAYSRVQELDADRKAVELLQSAYGKNGAAETMAYGFRIIIERHGATGGGLLDAHPNIKDRLQAMEGLKAEEAAISGVRKAENPNLPDTPKRELP